jgi:predicted HicB family RNase H-like nuclease
LREATTVKKEVTSVKVNPDLWKEAKIEAIRQGKTLSELIEEALGDWLKAKRRK